MKKLLAAAFCVVIGLLFVVMLLAPQLSLRAGAGVISPGVQNGDVNGDGRLDIADPVYTLLYLFREGSPPVACASPSDLVDRVALLEQAVAELRGAAGCAHSQRFVDNGDGTVTQLCTGLIWQHGTADVLNDGIIDEGDTVAITQARNYAEALVLANQSDWRLPTIRELQGLVDSAMFSPAISPIFANIKEGVYWSDTAPGGSQDTYRYGISFEELGRLTTVQISQPAGGRSFVLAVRGP